MDLLAGVKSGTMTPNAANTDQSGLLKNLFGGSNQDGGMLAGLMGSSPPGTGYQPNDPNNPPGRPQYQMVGISDIMPEQPKEPTEKHVLSEDAMVLREEMIGYVNAVLERMDKGNALKKFESF